MAFLAPETVLKVYTHWPSERLQREITGLTVAARAPGLRVPMVLGHDDIAGSLSWLSFRTWLVDRRRCRSPWHRPARWGRPHPRSPLVMAVSTVSSGRVRPDHTERVVGLRMNRQRRLHSDSDPLHLLALIEESVLDRPIGGPAVMRRQLEHLISMSERDNVEIRVLPTAVGSHDGSVGPFTLLDFAQAQSIAYIEIVNGAVYVQDRDEVAGYTHMVAGLHKLALSPADTVAAIRARLTALT